MKRLLVLLFLALLTVGVKAQYKKGQHFYCTANNVNIRKGPGKKYAVCSYTENDSGRRKYFQLRKEAGLNIGMGVDGMFYITYLGQSQNGYMHVETGSWWFNNMQEDNLMIFNGWVSAQYLRPVCNKCDGYGFTQYMGDKKCPRCHGRGY